MRSKFAWTRYVEPGPWDADCLTLPRSILLFVAFAGVLALTTFAWAQPSVAQPASEQLAPSEILRLDWGDGSRQMGLLKVPGGNYGPQSFAVHDGNKNLYILDSTHNRILVFDSGANLLSSLSVSERADDLALGTGGTVYVLYRADLKVIEYGPNGAPIATYHLADTRSPITGIHFTRAQELFFATADGHSYPVMKQNTKVASAAQARGKIRGLSGNNGFFYLRREKGGRSGLIGVLDSEGTLQKEIAIENKEEGIETLSFVGLDSEENIYIVVEEASASSEVKRYLRKYDAVGHMSAEGKIPYSNYVSIFRDLRVSSDGEVYQLLPLKDHVEILLWSSDEVMGGPPSDEFMGQLFSNSTVSSEDFLPEGQPDMLAVGEARGQAQASSVTAALAIAGSSILSRAESYRVHYFYVGSSNVTSGVSCGGKNVQTPVTAPGSYTGVLYKWGGFSGLTGVTSYTDLGFFFDEGLSAAKYAGDKDTSTSFGSTCAVGVDCSGFVSQTWGLSSHKAVSDLQTLPIACCLDPTSGCYYPSSPSATSYGYLLPGDILASASNNGGEGHVRLFSQRNADGSFTVYESSARDWKVSTYSYTAVYLQGLYYYAYRNPELTNVLQFGNSIIVSQGSVAVRPCAGLYSPCDPPTCRVDAGGTGTVVGGPQDVNGYVWYQVSWNNGTANCTNGTTGWSAGCFLQVTQSSSDTTPPTVGPVTVTPSTVPLGGSFTVSATVSDTGGSGLKQVELWRSTSPSSWPQPPNPISTQLKSGNGPLAVTFSDAPSEIGTYYYGVHAVDNAGNWSAEPQPYQVSVTPASVSVTVTTNPAGRSFTVDGYSYTVPQTFNWTPSSSHTIATTSPQGSGTRYVFANWSDGGAPSHTVTPTVNTTYTANFTAQYQLTTAVLPNGAGMITASPLSSDGYYNANAQVQLTATQNTGYVFATWTGGGCGSSASCTVTMNEPTTATAYFNNAATISVTVTTNPAGRSFTVDGNSYTSQQTFNWTPSSSHTIATTSPQGSGTRYVFANWSDGQPMSHPIAPTVNTTYTANFTTQYLLTAPVSPPGAGSITASPPSGDGYYNANALVQLTAAPYAGYTFANFSGDLVGGANPQTVTMNGSKTVTANFTQTYTLSVSRSGAGSGTVTSSPGGINCGSTCSASYTSGASVTLSAAANAGSSFAGWSGGGCGGGGNCVVTMYADTTVTATFRAPMLLLSPADLTFAARWVGFGTDTQGISVSNVGDAPLQIQSVVLSAPGFALDQHDCGGTLAPGAGCSLLASFKPSTTGSQSAVITVTDDTLGSPHIITLHGVGLDLILTLSRPSRPRRSSAEVVIAGATARFDLSVLSNATAGRVVFNCEGTPASSMCQVEPPVLDLGPGPSQVAVSFTTSTHQKAAVDGTGVEWQGTPLGLHVLHITATAGPVSRVIDIPVEVQQGDGLSSTQQGSEPGRNDRTDAVRPPEAVPHGSSISGQHVVIPERSESPLKTSRSEIVFGAVRIGNAASEEIEITNQAIGSLQLECRATGDFEVISDCGQVLEPGKTYSVKTRFTPARTGKRAGKLTVSSGDTVLTISLQGEGLSTQQ